jgi:hypothetical protein
MKPPVFSPAARVALALQHGQAHQRLHAAHEGAAGCFQAYLSSSVTDSSALRIDSGSGAFMRATPEGGGARGRGKRRRLAGRAGCLKVCEQGFATCLFFDARSGMLCARILLQQQSWRKNLPKSRKIQGKP